MGKIQSFTSRLLIFFGVLTQATTTLASNSNQDALLQVHRCDVLVNGSYAKSALLPENSKIVITAINQVIDVQTQGKTIQARLGIGENQWTQPVLGSLGAPLTVGVTTLNCLEKSETLAYALRVQPEMDRIFEERNQSTELFLINPKDEISPDRISRSITLYSLERKSACFLGQPQIVLDHATEGLRVVSPISSGGLFLNSQVADENTVRFSYSAKDCPTGYQPYFDGEICYSAEVDVIRTVDLPRCASF